MTIPSAPFTIATVFSSNPFGGNPAAIIFLDVDTVSFDVLRGIARNFNQPMAVFVKPIEPLKPGQTTIHTSVRFVTVAGNEVELCGHGSMAAAKALLSSPDVAGAGITEIQLQTKTRGIVRVNVVAGGLLEMVLPVGLTEPVSSEDEQRVASTVNRAFGRDVKIKHIARGGEGFEHACLIEIDESEDLQGSKVNTAVFGEAGYPFGLNTITSNVSLKRSELNEQFVSRMFSPEVPGGEDSVCGSAHCLLVPYWYKQKGLERGKESVAKQISWSDTTPRNSSSLKIFLAFTDPTSTFMATLKLNWSHGQHSEVYDLWSWSSDAVDRVVRTTKRLRANLYEALAGPNADGELDQPLLLKIARGPQALADLKHEAKIYTKDLLSLQGIVVPKFYGLYETRIKGIPFGCALLEDCNTGLSKPLLDPREVNTQVMLAICKIHQAGISHNDLLTSRHHIVVQDRGVRIIDFTNATRHVCTNAVPTLYHSLPRGFFCEELVGMEKAFGVHSDPASISQAILAAKKCWG
ncbi:hypothetical protein H1R20_g1701, partial [Candolleomyces eurysporus]